MIELTPSQKSDLVKWITDKGLNPGDFKWEQIAGSRKYLFQHLSDQEIWPALVHVPTAYEFQFLFAQTDQKVIWSPGTLRPWDSERVANWIIVKEYFDLWLSIVKREAEAPDLWSLFENDPISQVLNLEGSGSSEPFQEDEIKQIQLKLDAIRQDMKTILSIPESQHEKWDQKFQYLSDSATRLSKKDFVLVFIGWMLDVGNAFALTPENLNALAAAFGGAVDWAQRLLM